MQIKKDDVKNSLLKSAQTEFLKKGFDKASIRNIVKNAGTTIGNFYNYFESKEMVFAHLVEKSYNDLIGFINDHEDMEINEEQLSAMDSETVRSEANKTLAELVPKFDESFLLLVNYSDGTKFSNAKNEIIDFIAEHFMEHIDMYAPDYKLRQMGRIVSSQMVHGIAEIIKDNANAQVRHTLITEQILFTSMGVMGILMGGQHDKNN